MAYNFTTKCLECHFTKTMDTARSLGDERTAMAFAKALLQMYMDMPENVSSSHFGPATTDLLQQFYGLDPDRFKEEKIQSNRFVLERFDAITARVQAQPDPVLAGLQFAILGNYLDFSALQGKVSFEKMEDMLASALEMELDTACYGRFCRDLEKGKKLLFLTDNAGEIVFDRIWGQELQRKYPHLDITFCVRGAISANDATREDAAVAGIPFTVIDSGSRIGGTELEDIGEDARRAFEEADVIIAKGMGNTETLWNCGYNVYYAFLVKCEMFAALFERPMFTPMFVHDPDMKA